MTEQMPGELIYEYTIQPTGATSISGRAEARTGSLAKPCLASEPATAGRTRRSSYR
jgi:hypothetical protein